MSQPRTRTNPVYQMPIVFLIAALFELGADALAGLGSPILFPGLAAISVALLISGIIANQSRLGFERIIGAYIAIAFVICRSISLILFRRESNLTTASLSLAIFSGGMILVI